MEAPGPAKRARRDPARGAPPGEEFTPGLILRVDCDIFVLAVFGRSIFRHLGFLGGEALHRPFCRTKYGRGKPPLAEQDREPVKPPRDFPETYPPRAPLLGASESDAVVV